MVESHTWCSYVCLYCRKLESQFLLFGAITQSQFKTRLSNFAPRVVRDYFIGNYVHFSDISNPVLIQRQIWLDLQVSIWRELFALSIQTWTVEFWWLLKIRNFTDEKTSPVSRSELWARIPLPLGKWLFSIAYRKGNCAYSRKPFQVSLFSSSTSSSIAQTSSIELTSSSFFKLAMAAGIIEEGRVESRLLSEPSFVLDSVSSSTLAIEGTSRAFIWGKVIGGERVRIGE